MAYTQPHLTVLDTTTQAIASAGTPQVITFNTTGLTDKIAITSTSRFTVNETGVYLIDGKAQVTAGVANKVIDIWIRVNGTDVPNSNSKKTIVNNEVNFVPVTGEAVSLTAGQYIELWMNGDDTSVSLISFAAGTTPTRPVTPSIYLTILKIHP